MKKFLALLLALVMVFALAACGGEGETTTTEPPADDTTVPEDDTPAPEEPETLDPNDIEDNIEAESYEIAFVTDVGQLHDKSFN